MPMETFTTASGKTIRLTALESTLIRTVPSMRATGWMINNMDRAKKSGLMVLNMKVITSLVKRTAKVNSYGPIDLLMRVLFLIIIYTDTASINGQMAGSSLVIGSVIRCMARVSSHGLMAEDTRVSIMMIKSKEMEFSCGLMEDNMMALG